MGKTTTIRCDPSIRGMAKSEPAPYVGPERVPGLCFRFAAHSDIHIVILLVPHNDFDPQRRLLQHWTAVQVRFEQGAFGIGSHVSSAVFQFRHQELDKWAGDPNITVCMVSDMPDILQK